MKAPRDHYQNGKIQGYDFWISQKDKKAFEDVFVKPRKGKKLQTDWTRFWQQHK